MAKTTLVGKAEQAMEQLAAEMGLELVEVALSKEAGSVYLRICIDKENGVALSDCEAFHKRCIPLVETVEYDFLECSSPGIDRPLKTGRDYAKHIGSMIEVKLYRPQDGQKAFTGTLLHYQDDVFQVSTGQGQMEFSVKDTALVRPVIDWAKDFEHLEGENRT